MSAVKPPLLKSGERVALLCPASRPATPSVVARCVRLVEEMGFEPVTGRHVLSEFGPMAGTDQERGEDFNHALKDESIKGIFCLTGGWGALRVLNQIDFDSLRAMPKLILGCGDNTALLIAINSLSNLVVLHGPNIDQVESRFTFNSLRAAVTSAVTNPIRCVEDADDLFTRTCYAPVGGMATGTTIGGNLTALSSLFATEYQPGFKNKILCLEDANEYNAALDRWFTTFLLGGHLNDAAGCAFGSFENCGAKGAESSLSFEETASQMLSSFGRPACFGFRFGQSQRTHVLPIGVEAELDCNKGLLTFLEPSLAG